MIEVEKFNNVELISFQKAKEGNSVSGDAFFCCETESYFLCAVVDGLGSGTLAQKASHIAISYISTNHHQDLTTLMSEANKRLVNSRGIVLSIIKIDFSHREIIYSNIGNINCIFYSLDGVLIRTLPKRGFLCGKKQLFTTQCIPYEQGMRFIIYTDGLEIDASLHKMIFNENSVSKAMDYVVDKGGFKKDDVTFVMGEIVK